jgi:zinc and cadmium transporter
MSEYSWLATYSGLILLISLVGGLLPLRGKITHSRLQFYLSLSAGFMLGASFFHVMPDAMDALKNEFKFGVWMSLGVVGLFCIERFIAPHSHEMDGGGHHHSHEHSHAHEGHDHAHDHRAAAPAVAGWMAVLGLTIHTFMNGVGLAGQVYKDFGGKDAASLALPGLTIFLAIFFHKPADALAISTVLSRKGVERWKLILVQIGFVSMVPIGAAAFYLTEGLIQENLRGELTGAALAFSAGTFLFIALSDLLPEVQFHRHDRIPLFLALLLGVILMGGIALLEPHDHEEHEHGTTTNGQTDSHHHDHKDHAGDKDKHHHDDD